MTCSGREVVKRDTRELWVGGREKKHSRWLVEEKMRCKARGLNSCTRGREQQGMMEMECAQLTPKAATIPTFERMCYKPYVCPDPHIQVEWRRFASLLKKMIP